MAQLVLSLSGKKRSGKNTAANYIVGRYLEMSEQICDFSIRPDGLMRVTMDEHGCPEFVIPEGQFNQMGFKGVKFYSFADPLKRFCIDVLGLTEEQCYGTEEQKDSLTGILWQSMPGLSEPREGLMTARQVLQYVGTDIVRRIHGDAWVNATVAMIRRDKMELAIITDSRFPNEVGGVQRAGGKVVRLTRKVRATDQHASEIALDDFPHSGFDFVCDNIAQTIVEQNDWMESAIVPLFVCLAQ